jgi:SET domain-containing protein
MSLGVVFVVCFFVVLLYYAYYMPIVFHDSLVKTCPSRIHGRGLCAARPLKKGQSIGLLATIFDETTFENTDMGRYVNHSETPNVDLVPLKYTKRTDVYGYTNKNIRAGEELLVDYQSKWAPKPNFMSV